MKKKKKRHTIARAHTHPHVALILFRRSYNSLDSDLVPNQPLSLGAAAVIN